MKIGLWSTNAGSNNSTPPDGWPEGQAPSTINDCAREMMASLRTYINDAQYVDLGNTPSYLTSTTFSMNTADVTTFHVGRRVKLLDATTQYGTIDSVSATFVSVRLDPGSAGLSAQLSAVAVAAITATNPSLPNQVWTHHNVIINGNMDVWQRNASLPIAGAQSTLVYGPDRFGYIQSCGAACTISRAERSANSANVPSVQQAGIFLNSSMRVSCSAADAAIGSSEMAGIQYKVEGYDWRQIAHKPNILSFWMSTNRSGVYCVALQNSGFNQSFVQNFTVSAINTWQRFAITVPEAPTSGTWDYSNGVGLVVQWTLAAGASLQGGAGNWTAAYVVATSSQVNFVASAGNTVMLTGVQLGEGTQAVPLKQVNYQDELARCQRYYWRGKPPGDDFNFPPYLAAAVMSWPIKFPRTMRATPTLSSNTTSLTTVDLQAGYPIFNSANTEGFRILAFASASSINANFTFGSNDYIEANAEL